MIFAFKHNGKSFEADMTQPLDISLPLRNGNDNVNCFYAPDPEIWPVVAGDFVGSTDQGGPLNFMNVKFNPHGNGTHTECVGHIAKKGNYSIYNTLQKFHYVAQLITVSPKQAENGDYIILREDIESAISKDALQNVEALIIRTQPNDFAKKKKKYSGTNPCYLDVDACTYIVDAGIEHLLIDLPSVDREEDGGKLLSHKAFWKYPDKIRKFSTISELIFVENGIIDGIYLLNILISSFDIDVSPSKPILYILKSGKTEKI